MPRFTLCAGPRTEAAGFTGTTWPTTNQSNSRRTAASRSLAVGAAWSWVCSLDPVGDVKRLHAGERAHASPLAPAEELGHRAGVGSAGVPVADGGGE